MAPVTTRFPRRSGWSGCALGWLALTIVLLWASGWLLHDGAAAALDDLTDAERSRRQAAAVIHGVLAWFLCAFAGRWVWPHMMRVWTQSAQRLVWTLGLLVATALTLAAATGLMLLYGAAQWREAVSGLHWVSGLPLPLLAIAHGWRRVAGALRGQSMPDAPAQNPDAPDVRSHGR